jgi:hypothetical protein
VIGIYMTPSLLFCLCSAVCLLWWCMRAIAKRYSKPNASCERPLLPHMPRAPVAFFTKSCTSCLVSSRSLEDGG